MLFNYHTHTKLCNHASGENREYVEAAIARGLKTLGFSDHAPYLFPNGYQSSYRMKTEQIYEYAESVRSLAKEYRNDIRILCGFELEYYPDYHEEETAFLKQVSPDYLILGQHFVGNETNSPHVMNTSEELLLTAYVTQTISAMGTGDFLYLAHPDMTGWSVPKEIALREYRRLCAFAKKKNIPLEINLLGLATNRCYPSRAFFEIAAEVGNRIIIGADAHSPDMLLDTQTEARAMELVDRFGLQLVGKELL